MSLESLKYNSTYTFHLTQKKKKKKGTYAFDCITVEYSTGKIILDCPLQDQLMLSFETINRVRIYTEVQQLQHYQ